MSQQHHLKLNARGSWAHVLSFDPSETERIQDGAEQLFMDSGACVSFKIVDDAGTTLARLDRRRAHMGWSDRT